MTAPVEAGDLPRLHLVAMLAAALANAGLTLAPRESAEVASDLVCRGKSANGATERFGVSQSQVGNIVRGKCWAT